MKYAPLTATRLVIGCAILLALHAALLEVIARSRVIEKVMAMQFNAWEFALILAFLCARFAAYFLVPSIVVAFLVSRLSFLRDE